MFEVRRFATALVLLGICAPALLAQSSRGMFVFQNNFWVNLHQFLRGEIYRHRVNLPPGIDPASLTPADRKAWESVMEVYTEVAKWDLVSDRDEIQISNTLAMTGEATRLKDGLLDARVTAALNAAALMYRARLWPMRKRDNDAWNASAKALIERHEKAMAARMAKVYGITWPREPYLVDAVGEIGPNSAVTHSGPSGFAAHIQAGAASPRNTGDAPLELLFHEASHVPAVGGQITKMIQEECARQSLTVPRDLWHFMIMFTTGEVARRELSDTGSPGYATYGDRYNQLSPTLRSAFEQDWLPYVDGKTPLEQGMRDLIRDAR